MTNAELDNIVAQARRLAATIPFVNGSHPQLSLTVALIEADARLKAAEIGAGREVPFLYCEPRKT